MALSDGTLVKNSARPTVLAKQSIWRCPCYSHTSKLLCCVPAFLGTSSYSHRVFAFLLPSLKLCFGSTWIYNYFALLFPSVALSLHLCIRDAPWQPREGSKSIWRSTSYFKEFCCVPLGFQWGWKALDSPSGQGESRHPHPSMTSVLAQESLWVSVSSRCYRNPFKKPAGFSVMLCLALQLWVKCCSCIACSIVFGSLPIFFLKAFSPSFSSTNPKHKSGTLPGIAKLDFLLSVFKKQRENNYTYYFVVPPLTCSLLFCPSRSW